MCYNVDDIIFLYSTAWIRIKIENSLGLEKL